MEFKGREIIPEFIKEEKNICPTWLDTVKMEMENMESSHLMEPPSEVDSHDHVVGEAEPELRKIYSLAMQWQKTAMELVVSARFTNDSVTREQRLKRAEQLNQKSGVLMKVFWLSIRDAHDLWDKDSVGIRKEWKVVWSESNEIPPFLGLLGGILGER